MKEQSDDLLTLLEQVANRARTRRARFPLASPIRAPRLALVGKTSLPSEASPTRRADA